MINLLKPKWYDLTILEPMPVVYERNRQLFYAQAWTARNEERILKAGDGLRGCFSGWWMDNKFYDLSTEEGRLAVLAAAEEARKKRKRCKYLVVDPITFEFKFGCDEERDTDHSFCKQHRDLYAELHKRGGKDG